LLKGENKFKKYGQKVSDNMLSKWA